MCGTCLFILRTRTSRFIWVLVVHFDIVSIYYVIYVSCRRLWFSSGTKQEDTKDNEVFTVLSLFFPWLQNPWIILQVLFGGGGGGEREMFYAFVLSYFMFFELYKYTKTMVSGEAEIEMDGMSCNYMAATWEDKKKKLWLLTCHVLSQIEQNGNLVLFTRCLCTFVLPYYIFFFTEKC